MPHPVTSPRVRLLALVLAPLLLGATAASVWPASGSSAQAVAAPPGPAAPAATAPGTTAPGTTAPPRTAEERALQALLDARAAAVLSGDRTAFLATVDPRRDRFRRAQGRMLAALADVPLATWSYELKTPDLPMHPGSAALLEGGGRSRTAQVVFRYGLRGADADRAGTPRTITFTRRGDRFFVAADEAPDERGKPRRYLWEEGPVEVVEGRRSLVLGHPGRSSELRRLAAEADAAVPRVTAVWGRDWSRRVVVVLPSTQDELGRLTSSDPDTLDNTAGIAAGDRVSLAGDRTVARVFLNPAVLSRLDARQRRYLMVHEVLHVAARAADGPALPVWFSEGLAEHAAYRGSGLPRRQVAYALGPRVRAGRVPRELPTDAEFDVGDPRATAAAYEASWLAVELLVERYGTARTVRLYRAIGASDEYSALVLDDQLEELLDSSTEEFTAAWRRELRASLG